MAFDILTKANVAFKKLLGKAHTSNDRDPANEPEATTILLSAYDIWGDKLHLTNPLDSTNANIVASGDGVGGRVKLQLSPISGTNTYGKYSAYDVVVPNPVPAGLVGQINHKTGVEFVAGDRIGELVPERMGFAYIPKIFAGNVETPPSDASDWFVDHYAGIVTQETDNTGAMVDYSGSFPNTRIEAFVYIGQYASDKFSQLGGGYTYTFYDFQVVGNGITGALNGINKVFTLDRSPEVNSTHIFMNGILLMPGATGDYTISSGTITFTNAPMSGDNLIAHYRVRV